MRRLNPPGKICQGGISSSSSSSSSSNGTSREIPVGRGVAVNGQDMRG